MGQDREMKECAGRRREHQKSFYEISPRTTSTTVSRTAEPKVYSRMDHRGYLGHVFSEACHLVRGEEWGAGWGIAAPQDVELGMQMFLRNWKRGDRPLDPEVQQGTCPPAQEAKPSWQSSAVSERLPCNNNTVQWLQNFAVTHSKKYILCLQPKLAHTNRHN